VGIILYLSHYLLLFEYREEPLTTLPDKLCDNIVITIILIIIIIINIINKIIIIIIIIVNNNIRILIISSIKNMFFV